MKLHTEHSEVERGGVSSEGICHIKTTAKAFDILSSGIYNDKILAVIRELACNAYDSHIAAGKKDIPFEVHLPNSLEPWFHVKDNGIGLSDTDVMEMYTTYFESTKTHSNNFIGALGLGSKSPFSYTKAFEAISRFDGKRRIYSLFINEDGIPSIARLGESDTTECNGFEVKITVKSYDFYNFQEKAKYALRWFPVRPSVVGVPGFTFPELPEYSIKGDGWLTHKKGDDYYTKFLAVQANVAYKVDLEHLELGDTTLQMLRNLSVIAYFENGDLEYAPSREEVRYDARTKQALLSKIEAITKEIKLTLEKQISQFTGPFWNQVIEINKLIQFAFDAPDIMYSLLANSWQPICARYMKDVRFSGGLTMPKRFGHKMVSYKVQSGYSGMCFSRDEVGSVIKPESNIILFYNDMTIGGVSRVREYLKKKGYGNIGIIVTPIKDYTEIDVDNNGQAITTTKTWTDVDYDTEYDSIIESLGDPEVLLASTLDSPVREKKVTSSAIATYKFKKVKGRYTQRIDWLKTDLTTADLAKGGLYFSIFNGAHIVLPVLDGEKKEPLSVNWSINDTHESLLNCIAIANQYLGTKYTLNDDVVGFAYTAEKKVKKLQNWVNLFDVLVAAEPSYRQSIVHVRRMNATSDVLGLKRVINDSNFVQNLNGLDDNSTFKVGIMPFVDAFTGFKGNANLTNFLYRVLRPMGVDITDQTIDTSSYLNFDLSKYPMLHVLNRTASHISWFDTSNMKHLFEYITMVDRS